MYKRNLKGASLSQYAIILCLVGILLIPGFYLLGGNLKGAFKDLLLGLKAGSYRSSFPTLNNSSSGSSVLPGNIESITPGSLGGTPENPVKKCENNSCVIDFGDITLVGIPQNIGEFLQSAGSSGTTLAMLELLDQVIAQADTASLSVDKSLLKKLSNYGHGIASTEKELEENAKEFLKDPSQMVSTDFASPAGFLNASTDRSFFVQTLKQIQDELKTSSNPNDKNVKAIVDVLGKEILDIADLMSNIAKEIPTGFNVPVDKVQAILEPDGSNLTNLDSAIICKTGSGTDTGNECK